MRNFQELTDFERETLIHILKSDNPIYLGHIPFLLADRREYTGVGYYLYFKYSEKPRTSYNDNKTIGQHTYAEIEDLMGGAGFILYIEKGLITMLEMFSHSSNLWPTIISNFYIKDL